MKVPCHTGAGDDPAAEFAGAFGELIHPATGSRRDGAILVLTRRPCHETRQSPQAAAPSTRIPRRRRGVPCEDCRAIAPMAPGPGWIRSERGARFRLASTIESILAGHAQLRGRIWTLFLAHVTGRGHGHRTSAPSHASVAGPGRERRCARRHRQRWSIDAAAGGIVPGRSAATAGSMEPAHRRRFHALPRYCAEVPTRATTPKSATGS